MTSRIEQLIDELSEYIDNCKYQPLSNSKIIVNKDEIDELIRELRSKTPEELKRYQKVVSNQQAILKDAKDKAQALLDDAAARTNEMLSQNAIMQQAYAQADEVVKGAYEQAREILTNATIEANTVKQQLNEYMDGMLQAYENMVSATLQTTQQHYESFYSKLSQYYDVAVQNRAQINPPTFDDTAEMSQAYLDSFSDTGNIDNIPEEELMSNTGNIMNTGNLQGTGNIPSMEGGTTGPINKEQVDENGNLKLDLLS